MDLDLDSILSELKSERHDSTQSRDDIDELFAPDPKGWKPEDRLPSMTLELSRYEAYWLYWRIKVHLRSYEAMEWSEMKEVLECLITKIRSLSTQTNSCTAECVTPAEVLSEPPSTQEEPSLLSDAEDATRL
jgi:hypothetical protein